MKERSVGSLVGFINKFLFALAGGTRFQSCPAFGHDWNRVPPASASRLTKTERFQVLARLVEAATAEGNHPLATGGFDLGNACAMVAPTKSIGIKSKTGRIFIFQNPAEFIGGQ